MPEKTALTAVYDVDALKRFLEERGMGQEQILIFTKQLKIASLLALKAAAGDKKANGAVEQIKAALEKSGIVGAVALFEEITIADIDAAIAKERKKDKDAEDMLDPADAKRFDDMVTRGADMKLLGTFLKDQGLNSGKVLTVLQTAGGVQSLQNLQLLRAKNKEWAAVALKVRACGEAFGALFDQITDWAIAAALDASKQPTAQQAAARKQALDDSIKEVDKLQTDIASRNEKYYTEKKADLEKAYSEVVGRLAKFDLDFAAAEKPAGRDAMLDLFTKTVAQIKSAKDELAGIDTTVRPLAVAMTRGAMLRGYRVTPVAVERAREDLVRAPFRAPEIQDPGPYQQQTISYKTASTSSFAAASAGATGSNLAVAGQASGAGFMGSGIAAVSVAASVVDNSIKKDEEKKFESVSENTCGEIHYVYDPRQKIRFNELRFADAALERLRDMEKMDAGKKREAIAVFFEVFGSHFFREVTLGGRYEFHATGTALDTNSKGSLQSAVASARTWAVSASASYKGLNGAGSAAASVISSDSKASATTTSFEVKTSQARVEITTSVTGGAHGVPRDIWASSLQYTSKWEVIGRDEPMAVWEIIEYSKDLTDAVRAPLKALFEEVWVQDVFPTGSVEEQFQGLSKVVKSRGIKTAKALTALLNKYEPPVPDTPTISTFATQAENGFAVDPTARAHQAGQQFKLIGGGAKAEGETGRSLLTGSYPDQGAWEARAIAHHYFTKTKVTAYAIYLNDPKDEWDVKIVEQASIGDPDHLKTATAVLPPGYVLTCGGARADGGSRLLTKSYPGLDNQSWIAEARDYHSEAKGGVTAWAIGIKPKNGAKLPTLMVDTRAATGSNPTISRPVSFTMVGGGAKIVWTGGGGLLIYSYPNVHKKEWCVQASDHISPDLGITLTIYTLALSTAAPLSVAAAEA